MAVSGRTEYAQSLRVRAEITFSVWVLRHLSGKARGLRILSVWKGRATPPDGMDRRPNKGSYFLAGPKSMTRGMSSLVKSSPSYLMIGGHRVAV